MGDNEAVMSRRDWEAASTSLEAAEKGFIDVFVFFFLAVSISHTTKMQLRSGGCCQKS